MIIIRIIYYSIYMENGDIRLMAVSGSLFVF